MPTATNTHTTTRRRTLFGALAAFAAPALPAMAKGLSSTETPNPDADLLEACADLTRHDAWIGEYEGLNFERSEALFEEFERVHDTWWAAADQIEALPATTPAGIRAKALAIRMVIQRNVLVGPDYSIAEADYHDRLAYWLAADILALEGAG